MRIRAQPPHSLPVAIVIILLLTLQICPAHSIPQSLPRRQSSFAALQLPKCALTCLFSGILTDGCANESDFACHCGAGNIIGKSKGCIEQGCDQSEETDAQAKLRAACSAVGGGGSGGGRVGELMSKAATSSAIASIMSPTSNPRPSPNPSSTPASQSPPSTWSGMVTTTPPPSPSSTTSASPTATEMPLALVTAPGQLSDAAKAGIAVSICTLAIAIFLALGWYIRRLKRDLRAAQAVAFDERRTSMSSVVVPARSRSFGRGREPVSPLSPHSMLTVSNNGYGVLKKKRGHVLSIVVEQDDEDRSSLVREPVPGQREGLVAPLELDGEGTGVVELPLAITPRNRSRER